MSFGLRQVIILDFCLNVWQDESVGTSNNGKRYVKPYEASDGFYKFKKDQNLANNTEC